MIYSDKNQIAISLFLWLIVAYFGEWDTQGLVNHISNQYKNVTSYI